MEQQQQLGGVMETESNEQQLDAQQHRATNRAWSAPRVIEAELFDTSRPNPTYTSPVDKVTFIGFNANVGPGS